MDTTSTTSVFRSPNVPTEIRTFLIADIRGYTRFTVEHGDEAAARLTERFASIARDIVSDHEGEVIELRGDEALAVFSSARQALRAALELQTCFAHEATSGVPLHAGIGLDAGEAVPVEGGYRGGALNLAARLCALAGPGEVLASEGVTHLARKVEGLEYVERGAVQLKGFTDAVRVAEIRRSPRGTAGGVPEAKGANQAPGVDDVAVAGSDHALPIGGFLGALPAGSLVARGEELQRIVMSVDAVRRGSGRLVLLAGEPGVGKTRLAQEATLIVRNQSFLVAAGRCYEPRQATAFYPFVEALSALYAVAPQQIRADVPRRWAYLGRLLPNEDVVVPASSSAGQDEHDRLFWAVTSFLQAIAAQSPVALLLDDLHWADTSTLELLQHLARHTRADRVLLLGTYRDVEVGRKHPLERALRDLSREQLLERLNVRRLDQDGTMALMAAAFDLSEVSEEFATLVQAQTEGNPFFVQEVLRALVERGDIYREDGRWERREIEELAVPESIRSTIGERLSRLSEATQEILHEASVLGPTFTFDDLQRLADRAEESVEAALDEAATAGLVAEAQRDGYAFNHALTQQTLYAELTARRKRRLHLAAAEVLERLPESRKVGRTGELAWHFLQGDDPEQALRYATRAGDEAEALFAHAEAERHYDTSLDLARELSDRPAEAAALEKLGTVLVYTGRLQEAIQVLEKAVRLYQLEEDREGEIRAVARIGFAYSQGSSAKEGIARLQPVIERQEAANSPPSPGFAELYYAFSFLLWTCGRYDEQLAAAGRSVELARATGSDLVLSQAEQQRALALSMVGRMDEALQAFIDAIPRMERLGALFDLSHTLNNLGWAYAERGELDRSQDYIEQALDVALRLGDSLSISFMYGNLGENAWLRGEWNEARTYLQRARDFLPQPHTGWSSTYPALFLGELTLGEGKLKEGKNLLAECVANAEASGDLQALRVGQLALAEQDLLEGHAENALERLDPLLDRPDLEEGGVTALLPVLAEAQLARGQIQAAEETANKAVARAAKQKNRLVQTRALRAQSKVLAAHFLWDDAEVELREAVAIARQIAYPYAEGKALYDLAMLRLQKSGVEAESQRFSLQTREPLEEALAIFRRLGALNDSERTEMALAELAQR